MTIFDENDHVDHVDYKYNLTNRSWSFSVKALQDASTEHIDNAIEVLDVAMIVEYFDCTVNVNQCQTQPSVFVAGLGSNSPQLIRRNLDDMKASTTEN